MKLQVYAVRDRATQFFLRPFFCHTHGEAERSFTDAVKDPQSPLSKHPDDYGLWHLGEYDDNTGAIASIDPKKMLDANAFASLNS